MMTEMLGRGDASGGQRRIIQKVEELSEGWHGGGGILLTPPMIGDAQIIEKMEVLNFAALKWKQKFRARRGQECEVPRCSSSLRPAL